MSEQTRTKIREVAAALRYVPIDTGRSLSTRSTRRIAIVASELTNPFYSELVEHLRVEMSTAAYRPLLIPDASDGEDILATLADGSLDGVIHTTATLGDLLPHQLQTRGVPTVLVNRGVDGASIDTCVMDNETGAAEVAGLLYALGHRLIGAILGPAATSTSRDREIGLRRGAGEHGLQLPASCVRRGEFTYESGYRSATEILDLHEPPSALFCANDVIAVGACNAAHARGLTLGRDLTLIGFDDIAMARWEMFGLTTVRCDLSAMAHSAVGLLLDRIDDPARLAQRVMLQPQLVLRKSHGPPAQREGLCI